MSRNLTASDRKSLIHIAHKLEKGGTLRRSILSSLKLVSSADKVQVFNAKGRKVWVTKETLKGPEGKNFTPIKDDDSKKKPSSKSTSKALLKAMGDAVGNRIKVEPQHQKALETALGALIKEGMPFGKDTLEALTFVDPDDIRKKMPINPKTFKSFPKLLKALEDIWDS